MSEVVLRRLGETRWCHISRQAGTQFRRKLLTGSLLVSVEGVTKSFLPPAPFTKKMLLTTDHKFQELDNISHMNKRAKHFSICVDNVFEDPDLIRKWALTLDYTSHPEGHWPGKRSTNFQDIEPELNRQFIFKVLGLHGTNLWSRWEASLVTFHKIKRFSDNKEDRKSVV